MNASPSIEATQFLAFCRQGGDPATLVQSVVQGQQGAIAQEVNRVASAFSAEESLYQQRANAVVGQVVNIDLLAPPEVRIQELTQQAASLEAIQQRLKQAIREKNEDLALRCQQIAKSHQGLQQAKQQVKNLPSPYVRVIEAGGEKITAYISGIDGGQS